MLDGRVEALPQAVAWRTRASASRPCTQWRQSRPRQGHGPGMASRIGLKPHAKEQHRQQRQRRFPRLRGRTVQGRRQAARQHGALRLQARGARAHLPQVHLRRLRGQAPGAAGGRPGRRRGPRRIPGRKRVLGAEAGALPKDYARPALNKVMLGELIDLISGIALNEEGDKSKDVLGRVYEYFLGQFAGAEGKRGGEFYTPRSVVRVLVEMLEPYAGRVYDPCCG